jgi:cell wall-associated NlpC family hydrolase
MHTKKALQTFVILFLLFPFLSNSQIVTSKKEAIRKGIYQKPSDKKADAPAAAAPEKTRTIAVAADNKPKDLRKPVVKPAPARSKAVINDKEDDDIVVTDDSDNYLGMQMINNAMTFLGVRYHGGGTSKSGMDCSGMVTAVFNIFDRKLPRSSCDMSKVGEKLDMKDAKKGDLVFFRTNGKHVINHVGMIVEVLADEIRFIHSSSSEGVIISSTKEPYYKRTFAQINRVL